MQRREFDFFLVLKSPNVSFATHSSEKVAGIFKRKGVYKFQRNRYLDDLKPIPRYQEFITFFAVVVKHQKKIYALEVTLIVVFESHHLS